jgi:hypothetical protein
VSNCIEIYNQPITFYSVEIDLPRLRAAIDRWRNERPPTLVVVRDWTEAELEQYYCWWFLSDNVHFGLDQLGNPSYVEIHFGHGRSGHTNRDFRGLCLLLNKFMKTSKVINFRVADECDGFQSRSTVRVEFKPNGVEFPATMV